MKIALTGTSGIGKTTLAKALSERFSIKLIEEDFNAMVYAAHVLEKTPTSKEKESIKAGEQLLKVMDEWLVKRMCYFNSNESFIEDRFCIDAIGYLAKSIVGQLREDILKDLIVKCSQYTGIYDLIIVPPIADWSMTQYKNEAGLYRKNNFAMKITSQSTRIGLLEQFCAAPKLYINASCNTTEQRLDYVCAVISQLKIK